MGLRAAFERVLSLGQRADMPDRLSRQMRVTNALALLGLILSVTSTPIDAYGATQLAVVIDLLSGVGFGCCLLVSARGSSNAARIVLMLVANATITVGLLQVSTDAARSVFFPIALLPFLVFSIGERALLATFVAVPVAAYFATEYGNVPPTVFAHQVYSIYAPVLSFSMIIVGCCVFAFVERNADARLAQARTRAAHAAHLVALGEMATSIAHEVRNPLAAIHMAATEIVANPTEHARQLGERIQRIVMRTSRILETLRSLSRDASGDPFVETRLERIVSDALELSGRRVVERGVDLAVGAIAAELTLECRSVQISQVIVNLLGNAYDAAETATKRWVHLDVTADETTIEIAVVDSGEGVPADVRARIFQPFFTTKSAERGTGLGLSLSAAMVEAHHGTLELDASSPETRFVVRLPRVQPRVAAAAVT